MSVLRWVRVVSAWALIAAGACGDDGSNQLPDAPAGTPDAPPAEPGQLRLVQTSADFGSVVLGETSAQMSVAVTNVGMGPTGGISAAIAGGGSSNFTIASTDCNVLAPAQTCTVNLTFTPSTVGMKAAQLAVTASPGGTVMSMLDGIGIAPGALTITPSTHGFGNREVGQQSSTQTFTVRNTGGVTSGTLTATAGGSNPGEFTRTADTCNGTTLATNATCTFTVQFAPQAAGVKFATFTVLGNPGGTVVAAVNGVALDPANLVLNPTAQDFGSVVTGGNSNDVTFNVVNIGGVASGAISQTLVGPSSGDFTVVSSTCNGTVLQPSAACSLLVRFAPLTVGAKTATLTLAGTPGGTLDATLSGTAIAAGSLIISPTTNPFPNTIVGATSAAASFTVTNTGGSTTAPLAVLIGGTDATQFSISTNGCQGAVLAPNGTCTIGVRFSPNGVGEKTGSLVVAAASSGGAGSTVQAALSGNGVPAAQLAISPASRAFGSVGVGNQSAFQTFTVQNAGGTTTTVPTVSLGGSAPNQFTAMNDCVTGLAPLATCTISVRLAPTTMGNFAATVNVSAATGGNATANVFGQGVDPAALSVNPSALPFAGITLIGDASSTLSFTVTNNGGTATGPLASTITGANPGDFEIVSNSCTTLASGATCSISARFRPVARGSRTASIDISGTPGGSVSVALSGEALPRLEVIEVDEADPVNPYDFGTHSVGSSTCVDVVVRNNTSTSQTFNITTAFGAPAQFALDPFFCFGGKGPSKDFLLGGPPPGISAGGSRTVYVRFEPTSPGVKTGSVTFDIGAGTLNQAVQSFRGTAVNPLTIEAVTTANFGATGVNSTSPALAFRVRNADDAPPTGTLDTGVLQTARFRIVQDQCDGEVLFDGEECLIYVVFEPVLLGADSFVLTVTSNPGGSPSINVSGTGVTGYTVGGTISGHTGPVTLRNNGYDDVVIPAGTTAFTFQDRVGSDYTVTVASAPGHACTVVNGSGSVNNANVSNVTVTCAAVSLVGSYMVNDGPPWGTNPPTYSCREACAHVFGGSAAGYACSTNPNTIDHLASVDGWGDSSHCGTNFVSEDFKLSTTYDCGGTSCSFSAYVQDHSCAAVNYCFAAPAP